jgi:hypothetical protein
MALFSAHLAGLSSDHPGLPPKDKNAQVAQDTTSGPHLATGYDFYDKLLRACVSFERRVLPMNKSCSPFPFFVSL